MHSTRSLFFSLVALISTTVNMTVNAQVVSFEPNFATQYDSCYHIFRCYTRKWSIRRIFLDGYSYIPESSPLRALVVATGNMSLLVGNLIQQILKRSRWAKIVGNLLTPQIFGLSLVLQELLKKFLRLLCCLKVQGPYQSTFSGGSG